MEKRNRAGGKKTAPPVLKEVAPVTKSSFMDIYFFFFYNTSVKINVSLSARHRSVTAAKHIRGSGSSSSSTVAHDGLCASVLEQHAANV